MENVSGRILVVDDEPSIRDIMTRMLERYGHTVMVAATPAEARDILAESTIDLAIVDWHLDGESGMDLIKFLKRNHPNLEAILMTAYGSIESAVEAVQAGASDYITKPFEREAVMIRVNKTLERSNMRTELTNLRQHVAMSYGFDNIVGISKPMMQLKETAARIAPTSITVLISGASGTGKELLSRAIHYHSPRRSKPFVAIDCSAIPEALLESELFGHTRGSFTSAVKNKLGLFESAEGGTIFLDEVNNMPMSVQGKLLRFMQDSEVRPVGETETRKVDVRVIAATNADLTSRVAKGEFREDLFYRLNVIPLNIPNLVDRIEDIEMLTHYFLRRIGTEIQKPKLTITRDAVDLLLSHTWPGNVRELENTLKRGAALCRNETIECDDILFIPADGIQPTEERRSITLRSRSRSTDNRTNLLDNSQRTTIKRALDDNDWNFTQTAQELGIGRTTLWRKVKKYDLKKPENV